MTNINNTRRNVVWPSHVKRAGEIVAIRDMIANSKAGLFIAGTAAEGWAVYMEPVDDTLEAQQVSPLFNPEHGDKLADLRAAAERAYGVKDLPKVSDHPRTKWIWQTVEAPEARAERVKNKAVAIVGSAKRRFGDDVAGMLEWLETERAQNLYIEANTGNYIDRAEAAFTAEATAAAIISIREEPKRAADAVAAHDAAIEEQKAAAEPFNAALVNIVRKRFSITQGEVLVEYNGQRIEQYGDEIALDEQGQWHGRNDEFWVALAKREAIARGLAVEPSQAAQAVVESRPYSWNELTQAEQAEATFRGFNRGEGVRYIVNKAARDGESLLVRFVPHYVPRPVERAQVEPVAQARAIGPSGEDDIAFWTLEAAKSDLPLHANLAIPADVAEDIDAANWSVGSGIKDTRARREHFRKFRAEAYARMYPDHGAELAAEKAAQVATDPRTGRPIGDHGTGEQAIEWILHHADIDARLQASDFLKAWQEGDLFDEWPEFYEWLAQAHA